MCNRRRHRPGHVPWRPDQVSAYRRLIIGGSPVLERLALVSPRARYLARPANVIPRSSIRHTPRTSKQPGRSDPFSIRPSLPLRDQGCHPRLGGRRVRPGRADRSPVQHRRRRRGPHQPAGLRPDGVAAVKARRELSAVIGRRRADTNTLSSADPVNSVARFRARSYGLICAAVVPLDLIAERSRAADTVHTAGRLQKVLTAA